MGAKAVLAQDEAKGARFPDASLDPWQLRPAASRHRCQLSLAIRDKTEVCTLYPPTPAFAGVGGKRVCHPGKCAALIRDPDPLGPGSPLRCGRDDNENLPPQDSESSHLENRHSKPISLCFCHTRRLVLVSSRHLRPTAGLFLSERVYSVPSNDLEARA